MGDAGDTPRKVAGSSTLQTGERFPVFFVVGVVGGEKFWSKNSLDSRVNWRVLPGNRDIDTISEKQYDSDTG